MCSVPWFSNFPIQAGVRPARRRRIRALQQEPIPQRAAVAQPRRLVPHKTQTDVVAVGSSSSATADTAWKAVHIHFFLAAAALPLPAAFFSTALTTPTATV